jgi:hypothetical protein
MCKLALIVCNMVTCCSQLKRWSGGTSVQAFAGCMGFFTNPSAVLQGARPQVAAQ